jgi:polysaccharide biosynthesis/export protein
VTLILALVVLLAQGSGGGPGPGTEYTVGPQDVLEIIVHGQEAMSNRGIAVDSDGTIPFPELGRVLVAGKSPREIEEDLKKTLLEKQILTKVSMTVTVKEYRSQNIHVMGAVKSQGIFAIKGGASMLATAIAEAGGFSENAGSYLVVLRRDGSHPDRAAKLADVSDEHKIVVQREELEEARPNSRIALRNGDTIFVPRADVFYVGGNVKNPGEYVLRPNLTVAMAINLAGGYTDRAKKSAEIHRSVGGKLDKRTVKESDIVRAGDTVHVPARWF